MDTPLSAGAADTHGLTLDDKYTRSHGRIYLSGTQALVRLPLLQKQRDLQAGLNTGGYISGYRGSPLGGLDQALWKAKRHLQANDVVFQPGVNEDLAATAVWGSQQLNLFPGAARDGVFGMWYGKGPGVDRSVDVLKHANSAGSSAHGGVLMLAGDDHAAKSSSVAHQSEHVLIASGIPVLYPSNVQEYLDYGLHGWAMSRYTGLWVAMKCVTDVVESSASVEVDPDRVQIVLPEDALPEGGLNIRWPDTPLAQEARLLDHKWYAALAYVRANKLNRVVLDSPQAHFGIMTAGKAYLDVRQALNDLGLDEAACREAGIRVLKVGCIWPLDAQDAREFATGLKEILVVEEKRQILEYALKEELYNWRDDVRPRVYGKFDERDNGGGEWSTPRGGWLLPARHELSPALIARAIAARLEKADLSDALRARIAARLAVIDAKEREAARPTLVEERKPWFCSGCPHNTSTRVPEGSRAVAGIGCHYMAMWMDRKTDTFSQMGGEGVAWLGQKDFTTERHIFANLGDGTYFHSGLLAIRAAVAAHASITYKILYNDAVAMTGGQPVDGVLTVPQIAAQMQAEGVVQTVVVTDEPEKYAGAAALPQGVAVHHRKALDDVQRALRDVAGTTVLIYDQTCATEKRRRRKRGEYPDPQRRAFINESVCEGCGDCSVQSNCLSVEPLDTPLGTKRRINQSSCNKDFSCMEGFCPSFVTAEGATLRKPGTGRNLPALAEPPQPDLAEIRPPGAYRVVIAGVGGTGVVTVGALLGAAAHLEGKGVTVLDMAGLAQKGGAVLSHVQLANRPADLHATRVALGEADLVIGCDALVAASPEVLSRLRPDHGRAVVNSSAAPTAAFLSQPSWRFPGAQAEAALARSTGGNCDFIEAGPLAEALLGDTIYANPLLLGYAWQQGGLPLALDSLRRAIELNGVSVEKNLAAFELGRQAAHHGAAALKPAPRAQVMALPESLDGQIQRLAQHVRAYQDEAYAARFLEAVAAVRAREATLADPQRFEVTQTVARNLAKLMTYKDEYEVARLYVDPAFKARLRQQFEGEPGRDYQLRYHLAPPALARRDARGRLQKRAYGSWMGLAFRALAPMKRLRGTWLDVFGKTAERRMERQLAADYLALAGEFSRTLDAANRATALELAALPDTIRGYGHVKEKNVEGARAREARLWEQYRAPARETLAA
ncbi:indolepyruvate ferredoxin oxidoreductase family protein [Achromobacter sp. GD03932]|uniref:indolepyruvate ferredoxin oxidoreductase family protein n=1 Tax=Achromobacter sp. GD03932 TaxID=2975407 RepID=UPI00244A90ED|nr:indolepyruvate ferredoxin oxidoreductase family protein [Achromobacter sp. GD03932]MDH1301725.1 indolepyruvate ferredoxin oxidoreductase family protein [Achromobacter sp. GD03932]